MDRVGPYRVVRALGSSGPPAFIAREEGPVGFTREVVLKLVANPKPEDANAVKELAREATICAKLSHANIVRTLDFFEHQGHLALVLEHVDGLSLADLLARLRETGQRLADDAVFHIGVAVLEGLAHAHAHLDDEGERAPVVHRAVSPAAVWLGKDGSVKLGGFGLAKIVSEDPKTGIEPRDPIDMAPEQRISEKVDVYAAGLVLWELLTGKAPSEVTSLGSVRRDLPRELLAAVDAALMPSIDKRTIGCADMARWIKKVTHAGRGRKEVRERVTALAASHEALHAPTPARFDAPAATVLGLAEGPSRTESSAPPAVPSSVDSSPKIPLHGFSAAAGLLLTEGHRWLKLDRLSSSQRRVALSGGAALLAVFVFLIANRDSSPTAAAARGAPSAAARRPELAPAPPDKHAEQSALAVVAPTVLAPTPMPTPTAAPTEEAPIVALPAATSEPARSREPAAKTKFGFLTVHSTFSQGYVYVHMLRYGRVEDRLIVPCGRRFVS
ncbi:MAG TPA: serine/threonine-protein kinase, partial [Polyangiaceae bacterium]|nr:serine/threonine-protein kinase [Polyangiaceae bacterium]